MECSVIQATVFLVTPFCATGSCANPRTLPRNKVQFRPMRYLLAFILLTLSACGFHLRDSFEILSYLQTVQVLDAVPATAIAGDLRRALQNGGVVLTDDTAQADAVLRLQSETYSRRVQAVDADGRAQEYGLRYGVVFSVLGADGVEWLSDASVSASRDLRFSEFAVLGTGGEEEQLRVEMRRDAVRGILRQLSRVTPKAAGDGAAPAAGAAP